MGGFEGIEDGKNVGEMDGKFVENGAVEVLRGGADLTIGNNVVAIDGEEDGP